MHVPDAVLVPPDWSPVGHYTPGRVGRAEVRRPRRGTSGAYWLEGVRGGVLWRFARPTRITVLTIRRKVWMTDEPPYTWSLQSFAERARGDVLVAGLGLGIVVHQLLANPLVTRVTVVEREADVLDLVGPRLPTDARLAVIRGDFYDFVENDHLQRDAVIWDLAVWDRRGDHAEQVRTMLLAKPMLAAHYGSDCRVFVHGLDRDPAGEAFVRTPAFRELREALCGGRRAG